MGLFNILKLPDIDVQFRHADDRLHEYRIGDSVVWPTERHHWAYGTLLVPGIGEADGRFRYFKISITDDIIETAVEISETDFEQLDREYNFLSRARVS